MSLGNVWDVFSMPFGCFFLVMFFGCSWVFVGFIDGRRKYQKFGSKTHVDRISGMKTSYLKDGTSEYMVTILIC